MIHLGIDHYQLTKGLMGLILRLITPLSVAPCVTMIGISLFEAANAYASKNWAIAAG